MIEPGNEVVLVGDGGHVHIESLYSKAVNGVDDFVGCTRWCHWPQGQIRLNRRNGKGAGGCVRHIDASRGLLALAESLIGNEDESSIFHNGGAGGTSKLDAAEGGNRRSVKIVSGVENAVAVEEERGSV